MSSKKFIFQARPVGEIIETDYMGPKGMDIATLASALNIPEDACETVINGQSGINAEMALRLSKLFDENDTFWMNAQAARELEEAKWARHQKDTRYYFLHIKKCAGTTLIGLANKQPYVKFHTPHANGNPAIDDPSLKGEHRYLRYWEFDDAKHKEFLFDPAYNFMANEVHLGDTFDHHPELVYFTILRNPVKRTMSHYYHMSHLKNFPEDHDIDAFIIDRLERAPMFNNYMTLQITGRRAKFFDADIYAEAIARLEKFDHIFFQETFSEDIEEFTDYGWDMSLMTDRNVRAKSQKRARPKPETLDLIAERNQTDQAIYDYFWNKRPSVRNARKGKAYASTQRAILPPAEINKTSLEQKLKDALKTVGTLRNKLQKRGQDT